MELGYSSPSFNETNLRLDDKDTIARFVSFNPFIDEYHIFDMMGRSTDDNSLPDNSYGSDSQAGNCQPGQTTETDDPVNHTETRYLFVDLKNPGYGSDMSRIVRTRTMVPDGSGTALNRLVFVHLLFGGCAIVIGCILAYWLSRKNYPSHREHCP